MSWEEVVCSGGEISKRFFVKGCRAQFVDYFAELLIDRLPLDLRSLEPIVEGNIDYLLDGASPFF